MGAARVRREYAEAIRTAASIASERLFAAFASVPRENFLGPGPWTIAGIGSVRTREADPERLRHDVSVAIDAERNLYSGAPTTIAPWLEALDLREGDRVFHVGCGTGYYSAVMAETVGPSGHVIAVEVDPAIAARARENLAYLNHVEVITGDGAAIDPPLSDGILIHAGVTHPRSVWLDCLRPDGRLLLPLTFEIGMPHVGKGAPFTIQRRGESYDARLSSGPIILYSCVGARDAELNQRLLQAFQAGGMHQVRSLRRDSHELAESCWFHGNDFCFSHDQRRGSLD